MVFAIVEPMTQAFLQSAASHLLQSTLFALLAGLLALSLKNARAQTRHWIWFLASVKFLVPFALLVGIGSHLGGALTSTRAQRFVIFISEISQPLPQYPQATSPGNQSFIASSWPTALLSVWLCGFSAVLIRWSKQWKNLSIALRDVRILSEGPGMRALRRLQARSGLASPIQLAASACSLEPGVFGIFRPMIVLPEGIFHHLNPLQLEAILAHEIAHIRRYDNLTALVHMFVEAVFWFHPLVWWLGARIMSERERACDEEVLRLGSEPEVYAQGILKVCRLCLASPMACLSGVTGSNLQRRIEQIMTGQLGEGLSRPKRLLLAVSGATTIVAPIVLGLLFIPASEAQPPGATSPRPIFDVASIKPSGPDSRLQVQFAPGGRLRVTHATLRFLIKIAYDVGDDQISGGPGWINSKRFDLDAKPDEKANGSVLEQGKVRLQALLEDRFQLKLQIQEKQFPVFALVIAKNGPKMEEVNTREGEPFGIHSARGQLNATKMNMTVFARVLSENAGRKVLDMTGLKGAFNFNLEWTPELNQSPGPDTEARPIDQSGPSLFTAVQEQLGLKLEPRKGPAPFLVVERAEPPSEN